MRAELAAALALLTRLPVGWLPVGWQLAGRPWPDPSASVWAYPVVGALVGLLGGAAILLARHVGLPPGLAALLGLAAMLLLTGALHEDGLADTADGLGGGGTVARKLEIMRDSRIGSYGALALILALALRAAALAAIPPGSLIPGLVAAGGLGRGAIVALLLLLRPARADGPAAALRHLPPGRAIAGLLLAAAASLLLPFRTALLCTMCAALAAAAVAALAKRQVGGYTGDILGAAEVVTECVVLCAVVASID